MTKTEIDTITAGDIVRKGNGATEYRVVNVKTETYPHAMTGELLTVTKAALVRTTTVVIPKSFVWINVSKLAKVGA